MGRYRYTQRIGRGGMAQVFLAMQEGIGGFEKPVVIKRIFPHLCEDEHFIRMFLDEARLAATVRHPNVVEIFDIGQDQEGYFIVMEYLCGETLAFMAHTLSKQGLALPPHIVCRVLASVAAGLHHAHTAKDASGKPQPVVHRDVTPSNLLVCYNGAVKIVDFGVAKAVSSAEDTKVGAIKGKLAYLSPEQIQRKPVDARTDIFQLGIVLHELLSGHRLFNAASEHGKLQAVLKREVPPPSSLNPAVPAHVDHIVLRALERDPSMRPESADELRGLLEGALKVMGETVTGHALGAWMQDAFSQSYADRLAMERSSAAKARDSREIWTAAAEVMPADRMPTVDPGQHSHTPTNSGQALRAARVATGGRLAGTGDEKMTGAADNQGRPAASHPAPNRRTWLYAAVLLMGVAALGVMVGSSRHGGERAVVMPIAAPSPAETADAAPTTARTYSVAITAIPNHATIELDGQLAGAGALIRDLPRDGSTHVLLISAPGYAQRVVTFSAARLPEPIIRLEPIVLPVEAKRSHRSSSGTGKRERADDRRSRPARSDPTPSPHTSSPPAADPAIPTSPNTDNIDPWAQ